MHQSLLDHVLEAAATVFGEPVAPHDDFFTVGGDSVTAVELAVELERRLSGFVDANLITSAPHFGALANALAGKTVLERSRYEPRTGFLRAG